MGPRLVHPPLSCLESTEPLSEWTWDDVENWFASRAVPAYSNQVLVFDRRGKCTAMDHFNLGAGYLIKAAGRDVLVYGRNVENQRFEMLVTSDYAVLNPRNYDGINTYHCIEYIQNVKCELELDWFRERVPTHESTDILVFDRFGQCRAFKSFRASKTYLASTHAGWVACWSGDQQRVFVDSGYWIVRDVDAFRDRRAREYRRMVERNTSVVVLLQVMCADVVVKVMEFL